MASDQDYVRRARHAAEPEPDLTDAAPPAPGFDLAPTDLAPTPPEVLSPSGAPLRNLRFLPDPVLGQPLLRLPTGTRPVRVMLARSYESAAAGEPSQDYLVVRQDGDRLSFAVADGVGSSFLGNVAAQILAVSLVDWLAELPEVRRPAQFAADVSEFLTELSARVQPRIATWELPATTPVAIRQALEGKRAYGSEAMLACGLISGVRSNHHVSLALLGDTRVVVLERDGRRREFIGSTADRWSSRLGPRGRPLVYVREVPAVSRVIACSDGLASGLEDTIELSDVSLRDRLEELVRRPGNDDISLVDIGLDLRDLPPEVDGPLASRRGVHSRHRSSGSAIRRLLRRHASEPPRTSESARAGDGAVRASGNTAAGSAREPSWDGPTAPHQTAAASAAPGSAAPPAAADPVAADPVAPDTGGASAPAPPADPEPAPVLDLPPPDGIVHRRLATGAVEVLWLPGPDADAYCVEAADEPTFENPLQYTVRGTQFEFPPLTDVVWLRLRCRQGDHYGPWSQTYESRWDRSAGDEGNDSA